MRIQYLTILLLAFLSVGVHARNQKGEIYYDINNIKQENGSLLLSMDISIRGEVVDKCEGLIAIPMLEASGRTASFPYIVVKGSNKSNMYKRWYSLKGKNKLSDLAEMHTEVNVSKETDRTINYMVTIPYESWMDGARLVIREELLGCNNQLQVSSYAIERFINSRLGTQPEASYLTPPVAAAKPEIKQGENGTILFPLNSSEILPDFGNNRQVLATLRENLSAIQQNTNQQISTINIKGYASPEGPLSINERLSRERALALRNYITRNFGIDENSLVINWVPEDWDGFAVKLNDGNYEYRNRVNSMLNSTASSAEKERQLKSMDGGRVYRSVVNDILPDLRRAEYQVNYAASPLVSNTTNPMGQSYAPEIMIEHRENLYKQAARQEPGSKEYAAALYEIVNYYPDDVYANVNIAAYKLNQGDLDAARNYLQKANNHPSSWNNWGIYYLYSGDIPQAREYFSRAAENKCEYGKRNLQQVLVSVSQ